MRKPVRGWVFLDQDGQLWDEMNLEVWDERIDGDMVPAVALSLAPEDVEARRRAGIQALPSSLHGHPEVDIWIEWIEAAWGLSPEEDDG